MNVCMTSGGLTRDAKIRDQSKGGLTFAVVRGHTSPRPSRFCSQSANRLNPLFAIGWPHFQAKIDSVGGEKRKERVGQLTGSCTQFRNTEWHSGLATISLVVWYEIFNQELVSGSDRRLPISGPVSLMDSAVSF